MDNPCRGTILPPSRAVITYKLGQTMKQFTTLHFLSLLLLAPSGIIAQNLLTNPGFEDGLAGWTTIGTVTVGTNAHSGTKAARLGGNGYASIGQIFPATPGTAYNLSGWGIHPGGAFGFELRFLNSSYAQLPGTADTYFASPNYQEFNRTGTAPAGTAFVYALAFKDGSNAIDLDDWSLTVGGGPLPDLATYVTIIGPPPPYTVVQEFYYFYFTNNIGNAPASNVNLKIWISNDPVISADDVLFASTPHTLPANFFDTGSVTSHPIPSVPSGQYYLLAKIDPDNLVAESNEGNNTYVSSPFTIQGAGGLPDFDLNGFGAIQILPAGASVITANGAFL